MKLFLLLPPTMLILSASALAQFESQARNAGRTGRETFPLPAALPAAPVGGADSCATPDALGSATGSIAYNLVGATTGAEGQTSFTGGYCNYGCAEYGTGQVGVLTDVWFSWTAPASGRVRISGCPSQNDTKIAVYSGTTCPTGTVCVACSDDYHFIGGVAAGLVDSTVYFDVTLGNSFLVQVGQSSFNTGAPGFAGSIVIDVNPPHATTGQFDDGAAESDIGAGAVGTGNLGLNRLGNVGDVTTLSGVSVCWGWAGSTAHTSGTPAVVALWTDPNSDGNPTDAVLVESVNTTVQSANSDTFVTIPFTSPHTVNGVYFIGYGYQRTSTTAPINYPLTIDCTVCTIQPDTAWTVLNTAQPVNVASLAANTTPPTRLETNCQAQGAYNGVWHSAFSIRPVVVTGPPPVGTGECFGDGTGPPACPCANNGASGRGCANSAVASTGALLTATGVASISADTVTCTCTDLTGPGLFFSATGVLGTPVAFGDGILCAAVGIVRMGVVFPTGNSASYPGGLTPNPVHVAGGIAAPGTFHFQCWYRDAVSFCTPATYNLSNGLAMVWGS